MSCTCFANGGEATIPASVYAEMLLDPACPEHGTMLPGFTPTPERLSAIQRSARGMCCISDCLTPPVQRVRGGVGAWLWICEFHAKSWRAQG